MTYTIDEGWHRTLDSARICGFESSPRGMRVRELFHHAVSFDMRYPVLRCPGRRLNYRFMAAEALWILEGSDRLADLAPYNPNMARFSDDGVTLAGAYGPRIVPQIPYVVRKIVDDPATRQATLTIWTPNPASSKDVPCTVAMDFKLRAGRLDAHVFMRSSDVWLGLPYDAFSFSCVAFAVVGLLRGNGVDAEPGTLYVTAASSHLYEAQWAERPAPAEGACLPVPEAYWSGFSNLTASLRVLRDSRRGDVARWWER